jgi:purine-binding chemotaxis protein CheW
MRVCGVLTVLVADRVFEVVPFRKEQIETAPDIGVRWRSDYIAGVVRRESGFVVVVDLARLFSDSGSALADVGPQSQVA